jgi:hypothetical protein
MIIIDDVLPKTYADEIENTLFSPSFPWYYADDITYGQNAGEMEKTFGFFHMLYSSMERVSTYGSFFEPLYHIALSKAEVDIHQPYIYQARTFLQVPSIKPRLYNNKHVDMVNPHLVVLYYVNDSDGDTHLFEGLEIIKKIEPKKNRVVIFDGSIYHSSGTPALNKRCVINFNIVGR